MLLYIYIYIYKLAQRNSNFICIDIYNLEESAPRFFRLKEKFSNNMTEVYLLFYSHVLQFFVTLNLFLQKDEPIIGAVYDQVLLSACIATSHMQQPSLYNFICRYIAKSPYTIPHAIIRLLGLCTCYCQNFCQSEHSKTLPLQTFDSRIGPVNWKVINLYEFQSLILSCDFL